MQILLLTNIFFIGIKDFIFYAFFVSQKRHKREMRVKVFNYDLKAKRLS